MNCGHRFQNKRRKSNFFRKLLDQYIWQRQTCNDLAKKYKRSEKWIRNKLDENKIESIVRIKRKELILIADVTFFSRTNGLCVFREPNIHQNVWWQETVYETTNIYRIGRRHLEQNGFTIQAVVLDGKRGVREVFRNIPVQMCHFHQKQIIRRYLTNRPKLEASIELKEIVKILANINEKEFTKQLNDWHNKWKDFLKEKTINPETNRWCYTHKKLRSAYRSLKTNLPYLFTYLKYPNLNIPNTTNSLDGYFNILKSLINVHRGLNSERRYKIAIEILRGKD